MTFKGFKGIPSPAPREPGPRDIDRMASIRLYQGKWTNGIDQDADPFVIDKIYEARVGVSRDGEIFGLVDDWHLSYDLPDDCIRISMMSYRLDEYFVPAEVIDRMRDDGANGRFLFNAGGMGVVALWAEADDMERAFRELDLL